MQRGARANSFDAIRLCAAVAVLVAHAFVVLNLPGPQIGDQGLGTIAVLVFFGISGYLITQSWVSDPHVPRFALKRVLRIYPALIVVVGLTVFVLGPLVTKVSVNEYGESSETWKYLVMNMISIHSVFLLKGVFVHNPWQLVNRSLWTLPGELFGYVSVAAIGIVGAFRSRWIAVPALIAAAWFAGHIPASISVIDYTWLRAFAVGAILFLFRDVIPRRIWIGALLVVGYLFALRRHDFTLSLYLLVIAFPYCAIAVAHRFPNFLKPITQRGDFSYGMYLYGWPVEQLLVLWLGRKAGVPDVLLLGLAVTTTLAVGSWFLVEKPALALKRRTAKRAAPKATEPPAPPVLVQS
jgi:peptidoglycan/LPS O-acetylase OafA/YrhL